MPKTRWVRQLPTASVRRERVTNNAAKVEEPHAQVHVPLPAEKVPVPAEEVPVQQAESFPGGLEGLSVLRSF